jgi:hypothetical protein
MKANSFFAAICKILLLAITWGCSPVVYAQAPIYKFKNPTLISGTGGAVNAVYRFPNVYTSGSTNIDALVKITGKSGTITLQNIDRNADGYDEAFQPEYKIGSNNTAWFEFQITFVSAGTSTAVTQALVDVSALDIDGSTSGSATLKEFNRVDMGGGVCTFNTLGSQLTLARIGTAFEGANFTGVLFGALVDTAAKEVMFSVRKANISSFTYRVGANNQTGSSNRYASLYFKRFNYPEGAVLSASPLISFAGTREHDNVKLTWTVAEQSDVESITVEKSSDGKNFRDLAVFWANIDGSPIRSFDYTDASTMTAISYYRLKIESANGKTLYSNLIRFEEASAAAVSFKVYPSIIHSQATVSFTSDVATSGTISIVDMSGRVLRVQSMSFRQGINNTTLTGLDQLTKGAYLVYVNASQYKVSRQVIIQ